MSKLHGSTYFYVDLPCVNMREQPSEQSAVVSQGIYSESIDLLDEQNGWACIQTSDGYVGWVKKESLHQRSSPFFQGPSQVKVCIHRCSAHLYQTPSIAEGPVKTLPFESHLELIDEVDDPKKRWLRVRLHDASLAFVQRGDLLIDPQPLNREQMVLLSTLFLNLPYTWGGRTSFGYDCSGFTQMLYRQMNISIPRDARDQIKWTGFKSIALGQQTAGDLLFFGPSREEISHVGMCLSNDTFIHATSRENKPYLRISSLNDFEWSGKGDLAYVAARG